MKTIKSSILKTSLIAGLFIISLSGFANDITIRKDDPVPPPGPMPLSLEIPISVTATVDATELAVYFDYSVGDAIITVYDGNNQVVYQDTVDTYTTTRVSISSGSWSAGNYILTIHYGTTDLIGDFVME